MAALVSTYDPSAEFRGKTSCGRHQVPEPQNNESEYDYLFLAVSRNIKSDLSQKRTLRAAETILQANFLKIEGEGGHVARPFGPSTTRHWRGDKGKYRA